jgi:glycosyltransferase involved in cell wall biosynthesis
LFIGWLVKTLTFSKAELVFDCQGSLAEEMMAYTLHKSSWLKPFYYLFKLIERNLLKLPDVIFCSSKNSDTFIKKNYSVDHKKLHVLEDAVDTELFEAADKNPLLRSDFGINKTDLVFVYSGSLSRAKGVHLIIDALPEIFESRPDIKFLLIGYGDMEDEIRTQLVKYIDGKQLIMTGRLSYFDLPHYLKLADYAVEPKQGSSESSGKLYNYVEAGLPLVCFENKFTKQILGDAGVYVDTISEIQSLQKSNSYYDKTNVSHWSNAIKILLNEIKNEN